MGDPDYLLAIKLQQEYDKEIQNLQTHDIDCDDEIAAQKVSAKKQAPKRRWEADENDLNCTQNLVHPEWETLDPTPDIHAMFLAFDNKFFQGRLKCVTLEWSKKMYSCAGICYSKRNGFGMAITIRLSEPLLKLRPRKNLVETLLHEMIHAYCFVLGIREGNGGHGPNFQKIMHGINKVAGTNITVYHTFHDEVNLYKVHWWRCNGICQHRKPFFGYVKRTSNRAPGPNDNWWTKHVESCGGTFLKIKGPEPAKRGRKAKEATLEAKKPSQQNKVPTKDIRTFFETNTSEDGKPKSNKDTQKVPINRISGINNVFKGPVKTNGGGTLLLNPKTKTKTQTSNIDLTNIKSPKVPKTTGNLKNVVGLKDISDESGEKRPKSIDLTVFPVSSQGYSLSTTSTNVANISSSEVVDRAKLRDIWSQRFSNSNVDKNKNFKSETVDLVDEVVDKNPAKKRRRSSEEWEVLSDDLCIKDVVPEIINLSDEDSDENSDSEQQTKPKVPLTQEERQIQIKKEIMDNSDMSDDDIELIDDDYDDALSNTMDLTDTTLIDDFFGDDVLLKDFKLENSVIPSGSRSFPDPNKDIVTCPICQGKVTRDTFENHLDGCIGISTKVEPKRLGARVALGSRIIQPPSKTKPKLNPKQVAVLKKAGYSSQEIANVKITPINASLSDVTDSEDEFMSEGQRRRRGLTTSTHTCPVCGSEVDVEQIDQHLRICNKNSPPVEMRPPRVSSTPTSSHQNVAFQTCPVCNKNIKANVINEHLDLCLANFDDDDDF